jgi:hypothetical protein
MDCNTLADFRRALYACFQRAGDALMNLVDALSAETPARSLAELSLSPFFERQWPSLYEAFQDAKIDRDALQKLFAQHAPLPEARQRFVLGGDASSILRVESKTADDRTYVHASNLPDGVKPVRPGWQFSTLSVLPEVHSSWTYVLSNDRIKSTDTQASVMKEQLQQVLPLLPVLPLPPLWIGDGFYGSCVFLEQVADLPCDVLARLGKNRVLLGDPPPGPAKPGRGHPCWHGARFACHDPLTQGTPEAVWEETDANGYKIEVACWHGLHFKKARRVRVSVIRVTRHAAADTKRDPKVSWFVFRGKSLPPLGEIPRLYARRYSLEHAYRVDKQDLLWETPRLRTPPQFERWTHVVACVRNQVFLSRDLAGSLRQSWESASRASTPRQVRRCMGRIIAQLGTPARGCRPRGKSPGWVTGRPRKPVTTYRVVFKASGKGKTGQKSPVTPSKPVSIAA